MTYWLPDPLPLPPYTKKLYWTQGVLDVAVAWFIAKRAIYQKHAPCSYIVSQEELNALLCVKERKDIYNWDKFTHFKTHQMGDFLFVDVGKVQRHTYAFDDPENRDDAYLVFMKDGDGWRLYPRSLRSSSWDSRLKRLFSLKNFVKRQNQWKAIMADLPEYAQNIFDKYNGKPYRFGSAPDISSYSRDPEKWWDESNHPYWQHAKHALLACAAMEGLVFPPPKDKCFNMFHWTVFGHPVETHNHKHNTVTVDIPFDGWEILDKAENASPNDHQITALKRMKPVMEQLLSKHLPKDIPLFLEDCTPRLSLTDPPSRFELYNRPQRHPWIREVEDMAKTTSAHDGIHWLKKLPPDWRLDLTTMLNETRRQIP